MCLCLCLAFRCWLTQPAWIQQFHVYDERIEEVWWMLFVYDINDYIPFDVEANSLITKLHGDEEGGAI